MTAIHIVATGARTPLGLHAAASAAAYRAGIGAAREHPFLIDRAGDPLTAALDRGLDPRLTGHPRWLALSDTALREACSIMGGRSHERCRLPVLLALPEIRPGFSEYDALAIRTGMMSRAGLPVEISDVIVSMKGHAGGLALLAVAAEQMRQGAMEMCLVGGVDSYFDPDTIEWLDNHRQLVGKVSRSAFVPAEGAAFCLLMTEAARAQFGLTALATLRTVAVGRESKVIKSDDICLGEALTDVVKRASSHLARPSETINTVICDINGERYRGEEWGFVCLRAGGYFDDPTAYWSPADAWGDTGAASGPLFAMLACAAADRGYATGPRTMLWAGSEQGLRAAAILDAPLLAS
jgi:3-oxoacyl-[acyl-carrier-protein] synthase I